MRTSEAKNTTTAKEEMNADISVNRSTQESQAA